LTISAAQALYDQALQAFKDERIAEAIRLLEEALRADSRFADAYEALGLLYFREKRTDEAIRVTQELARLDPDHLMARTNLSRYYAAKGLLEEAEKEQAEARRLSWKAELRAKKAAGEAVEAEPGEEESQRILEQKMATYKKVIELDPKDVLGYFSLGTVCLEAKRYGEARETFEKAVAVNPNHSPSWLGWGQALEALGRTEDAINVYKKGIPAADKQGDIIPLKKMETRLAKLEAEKKDRN
jgi:superkiller protein 3